ncbi:class I SAM-dependent methyltransferase [Treponema sp. HNW]|uniref:class I SAM-dependent methyltransferase n=1 Tax=Treponema sp. HNW TaxID=3116654 RepID=UPI003D11F41A
MIWDKVAFVYDLFAYLYNGKVHKKLCGKIASMIDAEDEVLECACGTGMLSLCIAPKCKSLTAGDLSQNMLKRAQKKCRAYKNAAFSVSDIMKLDYPDNRFDTVIAANVIHLLDDPYAALKELERVCKNGGKIIIPTYMSGETEDRTNRIVQAAAKTGSVFKRQFSYHSYQAFFAEAGYTAQYDLIEGRLSCALAVIENRKNHGIG